MPMVKGEASMKKIFGLVMMAVLLASGLVLMGCGNRCSIGGDCHARVPAGAGMLTVPSVAICDDSGCTQRLNNSIIQWNADVANAIMTGRPTPALDVSCNC